MKKVLAPKLCGAHSAPNRQLSAITSTRAGPRLQKLAKYSGGYSATVAPNSASSRPDGATCRYFNDMKHSIRIHR